MEGRQDNLGQDDWGRGLRMERRRDGGREDTPVNTRKGNPVQSQYHLPELRDRRGKEGG